MIPNNSKLIVSVITKTAPQLSPLCPPKDLFIKYGTDIEVIKPNERQYMNTKLVDRLKSVNNRKNIIPKHIKMNDGINSFDIPFQCFL